MWSSLRRRAASLMAGKSRHAKLPPPTSKTTTKTSEIQPVPQSPPKQPQPSLEVEEALRRSSLRGMSAARAAASNAMERASISLISAVGHTRSGVERSIGSGRETLHESLKEGSMYAGQLRRSASETVEKKAKDLSEQISSTVDTATEEAYRKSIRAKDEITSRATTVVETASRTAPRVASAASSAACQNVRYATETLIHDAKDTRDRALRWLWWWGLAAVGVYGVATSLPRELICYAAGTGKQVKSDDESERKLG